MTTLPTDECYSGSLRLTRLLTVVLSLFYNHIINLEDFSAPCPPFKQLQQQFMIKRLDSLWFFTSKGHGKGVGGWGEVLASSWVNLHWYRETWANLFRINPLGENIEGSIQTTVLKQNEHLFPRHNYNCQGRKFFQNHLISEMGNKLVSPLGISTLVQWFIANLSMTQTHQIHQVSPFSQYKSLFKALRIRQALCMQYMLLSVTSAKPEDVLEKGALKSEDIYLASVWDVISKLISPTNQGVQFNSSPIQACLPKCLVNPQKHELCTCFVSHFLPILLAAPWVHYDYGK